MSITTQQLLDILEENACALRKTQNNLKKCPKQRLTKGYIEGRIKCIEEYWKSFKETHQELIKCTPKDKRMDISYFVNEDFYIIEDLYICLQGDLRDMLNSKQQVGYSSEINESLQSQVKLPTIQLPTFTGAYEDWPTFHDLFSSLVENNLTLSKVQKLHYLKASLSGEAEGLLKYINITENNYDQAWNILKNRYGNKKTIINSLLKKMFNQRKCTAQTANQIKSLLDVTTDCLNSLQNLHISIDTWDPLIIYLVVQRLDLETHRTWEEYTYNQDPNILPTWNDLKRFLESKFRTLELIMPATSSAREVRIVREKNYHATSLLPPSAKCCILCKQEHALYNCEEFRDMQTETRNDFARNKNLCYNCLNSGHTVFKCRLRTTCRICNRRHHTLLHEEKSLNHADVVQSHHSQVENEHRSHVNSERGEHESDTYADITIPSHLVTKASTALLATALVPVRDEYGHTTILRALIDQGSQANFINERASQLLNLKRVPIKGTITGVGSTNTSVNYRVSLAILSSYDKDYKLVVDAYVINSKLTTHLPPQTINSSYNWPHLKGLELADPNFYQSRRVDMLLGVEVYANILKNDIIRGPAGSPCAQSTRLGWILFGTMENERESQDKLIVMHHSFNIDNMLQTLWELEPDAQKKLTSDEEKCEKIYKTNVKRNEDGRYIVKLPFKTENPKSLKGNTREIATRRLIQLEKRFKTDIKLKQEYSKVIDEYLKLNHMEEVPETEIYNLSVYLPHHAVIKETSETTRVRVVFDASSTGNNNISLNNELWVGPQLQDDMRSLVLRWRLNKIGFVADIEKMYRQILVSKEDSDYQRLLWRQNDTDKIKDYRLLRVTFGTASAPYLAVKTLQQLADDEGSDHPIAAETIKQDFFMDDLMSGQDNVEEAIQVAESVCHILNKGGFKLQKWSSNNKDFMEKFSNEDKNRLIKIDIDNKTIRTLGLYWDTSEDTFQYKLNLPPISKVISKRTILSEIQKLFDPLGWLAPSMITAKIIIQKLWLKGVDWDDDVGPEIRKEWLDLREGYKHLKDIKIKRWLNTTKVNIKDVSIHGYCDSSINAYAAVAYLRVPTEDGQYEVTLLAAKTRVAPVKQVSLPRLELCGAVLLAKMLKQISTAMRIPVSQIFSWTDSTIVLSWLQGDPARWQTFVRNRVITILDNIGNKWFHVNSDENPADVASRGIILSELKEHTLWWNGPTWLKNKEINFRKPHGILTNLEIKKQILVNTNLIEQSNSILKFEEYETLPELLRTIVYCKRFLNFKKNKNIQVNLEITTEELHKALEICVKIVQREFKTEINNLKERKTVDKRSNIRCLNPYLDNNDILRVGGRLRQANLSENFKHPMILSHKNGLVPLIIAEAHKQTLHGGIQLMMNYIRSRFWIIRVKNLVTGYLHKCLVCARLRAKNRIQIMGDLPVERVTPARPFLNSGVDFTGPFFILSSKRRGAKVDKGYICLFICMATKAIHLELVGDLSTNSFLGALRRFISRRGKCSHLWSDQGTNFKGANRELYELWHEAKLEIPGSLYNILVDEGIQWHFIPPYSPNFGGLWEAGVKSVKYHLKRILNTNLTFEEMSTTLCQIEACLNSRPLCPIDSKDVENINVLTPGHFLIGEAPVTIPEPNLLDIKVNRLSRWQYTQRLAQDFWKRWHTEYLSRLQQRPKWLNFKKEFQVGDIVLVKEENLPPGKWALARVISKHPGQDNVCRVYSLKCNGKIIKRAITKLCELPIDCDL